jgi:hypothetical protein
MGEINLDAAASSTVLIKTRNEDGSTSDHHFELVPITKPRLDAIAKVRKQMLELREKAETGTATPGDEQAAAATLAAVLDENIRSTNGPVTITSLWEDGKLGIEHLRRLMQSINEERAADPPA